MRWFGFTPGAWVRGGEYSLLKLTAIILRTWRLMPAKMHPRWNRETWESQFYFTSRTLSGNVSRFAVDAGSRQLLPTGPLHRRRQIYFTSRTLSGNVSRFAVDAGSRQLLPTGPLHRRRQIYFTSRTLSGNVSPFPVDTGSRNSFPPAPCGSVAKFISPAALCLGT